MTIDEHAKLLVSVMLDIERAREAILKHTDQATITSPDEAHERLDSLRPLVEELRKIRLDVIRLAMA